MLVSFVGTAVFMVEEKVDFAATDRFKQSRLCSATSRLMSKLMPLQQEEMRMGIFLSQSAKISICLLNHPERAHLCY